MHKIYIIFSFALFINCAGAERKGRLEHKAPLPTKEYQALLASFMALPKTAQLAILDDITDAALVETTATGEKRFKKLTPQQVALILPVVNRFNGVSNAQLAATAAAAEAEQKSSVRDHALRWEEQWQVVQSPRNKKKCKAKNGTVQRRATQLAKKVQQSQQAARSSISAPATAAAPSSDSPLLPNGYLSYSQAQQQEAAHFQKQKTT